MGRNSSAYPASSPRDSRATTWIGGGLTKREAAAIQIMAALMGAEHAQTRANKHYLTSADEVRELAEHAMSAADALFDALDRPMRPDEPAA